MASVCLFWGTTYLGIRIAVESLPPATLMCVRYLLSGGAMLIGSFVIGARLPRGRELWVTALCGILTIGIGTGTLAYVEQWTPSGLSALFVTTSPFWLTATEAVMPGGEALHAPTIRALLVGGAGSVLLLTDGNALGATGGRSLVTAFLLLQAGSVSWAAGSIIQRRMSSPTHPFVSAAIQQLATGIAYLTPALFQVHQAHWTNRAVGATLYLAVFGGIIGYSSYVFAMNRLPVAMASIYTYINPIVAVLLGGMFYSESFTRREAIAMVVIFAGVWLVKRAQARAVPKASLESRAGAE